MREPLVLDCEDVAWFRDQPDGARGAAAALGRRIGLGEQRTAQLVLAIAELASNITKHAADGSLLLRVLRTRESAGVEVIVVDSGPGMADVPAALRDGVSSVGTLGVGLGAVQRLADQFDIHSMPGLGTVQFARFWPHPLDPRLTGEVAVGGITRPIGGEDTCGDSWAARIDPGEQNAQAPAEDAAPARETPAAPGWAAMTGARPGEYAHRTGTRPSDRTEYALGHRRSQLVRGAAAGPGDGILVMSCDGLGHGPMAALASQAAVKAFRSSTAHTPEQVMEAVHRALRGTRGAAVAVARLEVDGRVLFCGIGNISASVVSASSRSNLLSHPGIVGHQMRQLRTYEHRLPAGGALVMHSDGLSERWTPGDLAALLHHPPALIAAGLLRQAGTRRDDASVVVAKGAR
ncbi:ATP-binding SpoIIE family protein phosphatase [Streptomyces globisporus]|uniref:ATP-binding SpoIIE family protein phosphatase n=1 Tax=Streptomyces globisporus TaxID=1908 RepID=UPI003661AF94